MMLNYKTASIVNWKVLIKHNPFLVQMSYVYPSASKHIIKNKTVQIIIWGANLLFSLPSTLSHAHCTAQTVKCLIKMSRKNMQQEILCVLYVYNECIL